MTSRKVSRRLAKQWLRFGWAKFRSKVFNRLVLPSTAKDKWFELTDEEIDAYWEKAVKKTSFTLEELRVLQGFTTYESITEAR